MDQLEGRNPVVEALTRQTRRVRRVWLDQGAKTDDRLQRLLDLCRARSVPVQGVERSVLDRMAEGRVHNGVIAEADPLPSWTTSQRLDAVFAKHEAPLFLLCGELAYEHNLGAILRSSLGFGVHAVIVPTRRGADLSPVVQRVAMGGAEDVPLIRESFHSAAKHLERAGVPLVGADMGGTPIGAARLAGPMCLVLGSEGEGLTSSQRERCSQVVSIPLAGSLESLNVSVAAAVLLYEKRRQDGWFLS
jgi:23S rRNA (guanosine2251-2'-O)-methyltransferase